MLAKPDTWERFAALRDRVEDEGDALREIRAVLGPVETALWEQADTAAADPAERSVFADRAWETVDDTLARLGV